MATCQVLRLLASERLARHPRLAALGPDPLAAGFDAAEVVRRALKQPARPLGEIVLDQRVLAGIGNVLKSEGLFLAGADPFAPVAAYDARALGAVIDTLARTLTQTAARRAREDRIPARMTRRTGASLRGQASRLWVYERSGRPCLVCGSAIAMRRQGDGARSTYFCACCQPPRKDPDAPLVPPRIR